VSLLHLVGQHREPCCEERVKDCEQENAGGNQIERLDLRAVCEGPEKAVGRRVRIRGEWKREAVDNRSVGRQHL
jgi:hypothetical protein